MGGKRKIIELNQVLTLRKEKAAPHESDSRPYVALEHMISGQTRIQSMGVSNDATSTKSTFQNNDILFGRLRPYLRKCALAETSGLCVTDILVLTPKSHSAAYLCQLLHSDRVMGYAIRSSIGTKMPRVGWDSLGEFAVSIHSQSQQKRIAKLLDSIDTAIKKIQNSSDQQKRVKKAYLEEQFSRSKISYRPLKSYLSAPIKNGVSVNDTEDEQGDIILALGAVTEQGFNPEATKHTPPAIALQSNAQLSSGDIVVSRSNAPNLVGFAGLYEGIPSDCYYPDLLMRVRIDPKRAHPKFIEQAILSNHGRQYMRRMSKGTSGSMKKIDKVILEDFPVIDIPLDQQQALVKSICIFEERAASLQSTLEQLKRLKTALSQKIFN